MKRIEWISSRLFEGNKFVYFFFFCVLIFIQTWYVNNNVLTNHVYYQTLGEQVAVNRIGHFLALREKLLTIGYALIPLIFLIKTTLIATCINIGSLFFDLEIGFKKIFGITIVSEFIFILASYLKVLILVFFKNISVVSDVSLFYPFSLMNLIGDPESLEKWLYYPLLTINLFEVAYVFLFALGIKHVTGKTYKESFNCMAISYGIGLTVWIGFIMFLNITFS